MVSVREIWRRPRLRWRCRKLTGRWPTYVALDPWGRTLTVERRRDGWHGAASIPVLGAPDKLVAKCSARSRFACTRLLKQALDERRRMWGSDF